jgi:hypothetical protein
MRLTEMGSEIKEDQFLIHILNNLSPEYELQVLFMEKWIKVDTYPLTVEDLREELDLKLEREHIKDDNKSNSLPMVQFKGQCNKCGSYGHKGANCQSKNTPKKGKKHGSRPGGFKGNCNYCQKYGYKAANCFKKNKEGGEQASNAMDSKADEVVLAFDEKDLLEDLEDSDDEIDLFNDQDDTEDQEDSEMSEEEFDKPEFETETETEDSLGLSV